MTNYDWVNLREAIKTIVQVKQYGPVFLRLAWHDSATGNIWTGTGGPHSTMSLQDPEDPQNKGLQRAIDALDPLYDIYDGKISRADLWSYAGAVAVRVMGGPNTKWRPGRNDITHLSQARLKSPDNNIPLATDNWPTIVNKFKSMGLNESDIAALIHGGHGVGRCHREYSGYHGPWYYLDWFLGFRQVFVIL
ncbi:ascorbate peroxidase [Obelidium mucronatum]|nr:ascorbate peroxidase [Obelidium mucronatum]